MQTHYLQFCDDGVFLQNLIMKLDALCVIPILLPIDLRLHGRDECIPLLYHVAQCGALRLLLGTLILQLG